MSARRAGFLTIVTLAVLAWSAPTGSATAVADSGPAAQAVTGFGAQSYGYLTPVVVVSKGGTVTYTNLDIVRHDVVQYATAHVHGSSRRPWCRQFPRRLCPIFYSPLIGLGQSEAVQGLRYVKPGQVYTFYCTLHPGMRGTLIVQP
jgi:plastocyanin